MSDLDPTKRTFGVTDPDGLWLICCDCDDPQPTPCDCMTRIAVEFNMAKGVSRPNGVWQVSPHYSLQGYEGTAMTSP